MEEDSRGTGSLAAPLSWVAEPFPHVPAWWGLQGEVGELGVTAEVPALASWGR